MAKINIKVSILQDKNKNVFTTIGHYQEHNKILTYKEKDNTLVTYDYTKNILTRNNQDILMKYQFIKNKVTTGTILIKDFNKYVDLDIYTDKIIIDNQNIEIQYKTEDNFIYKIEVI